MDWNIVISTAIGTMGGTLLTVIAAWIIYSFEKKDAKNKSKRQKIYEITSEMTNTLEAIDMHIQNIQSAMSLLISLKKSQKSVEFVDLMYTDTKNIIRLSSKLNILSVTLSNVSEFDIHDDILIYNENIKNFVVDDMSPSKFNKDNSLKIIDTLGNDKNGILNDLQEVIEYCFSEKN